MRALVVEDVGIGVAGCSLWVVVMDCEGESDRW